MLAYRLFFILTDATVKTTLLLTVVTLIAVLARRASASFRHLVWALGLGGVLFLPLFSQALPQWHITVKTPMVSTKRTTLSPPMPSTVESKADTVHSAPSLAAPLPPTSEPTAILPSHTASVSAAPPGLWAVPWTVWACMIWAAGASLITIKMARSLLYLGTIAKKSIFIHEGLVADTKSAAIEALRLDRSVRLLLSSDATALPVPITWGTLKPVVVLPAEAAHWPQDKLQAIILHELAHVRRGDWLLQTLARVACAFSWFNPLVWFATRRMRAESEAACDDLVLAAGVPAPDYARHLLDIALQARNGRRVSTGAVAMAQTPRIEGRLRTVLATGRKRGSVGRRVALGLLATALLLTVPLAAVRPVLFARAQESSTLPVPATQTFPGGETVRLVGISYSPSLHRLWWDQEGQRLIHAPAAASRFQGSVTGQPGEQTRIFAFDAYNLDSYNRDLDASVVVAAPSASGTSGWVDTPQKGHIPRSPTFLGIEAALPASAKTGTVRVGIADQAWKTLVTEDRLHVLLGMASGRDSYSVMFSPSSKVAAGLVCTVSDNVKDQATRIVALDLHGKTVIPNTLSSSSIGTIRQRTISFPTLSPKDIKSLQFQARDYQWQEFRNLPLQPSPPGAASSASGSAQETYTAAAHITLGSQLQQMGQPRDGIPEFRRAVQIEPNNAEAQYELADALDAINHKVVGRVTTVHNPPPAVLDEAILHMQKAVALQPSNAQWHFILGTYLSGRGRDIEAVVEYKRVLFLLPVVKPVRLDRGQPETLYQVASTVFYTQSSLADTLVKLGYYEEAIAHYEQALQYHFEEDNLLLRYGDALNGVGRHAEARAAWKKVVALDGTKFYDGRKAQARLMGQ